jgi:hypothetical protein
VVAEREQPSEVAHGVEPACAQQQARGVPDARYALASLSAAACLRSVRARCLASRTSRASRGGADTLGSAASAERACSESTRMAFAAASES